MNGFGVLGAFVIRHRRSVLWLWAVLALWAAWGAAKAPGRLLSGSGDIEGSLSLRADSLWRHDFANPYGQSLVVAMQGESLAREGDSQAALWQDMRTKLSALAQVTAVMTSEDALDKRLLPKRGKGGMVLVGIKAENLQQAEQAIPRVRGAVNEILAPYAALDSSLHWAVTGRSALTYDLNAFNAKDTAEAEMRVIPLTLLILLLAFGSLVASGIPILLGLMASALCLGLVYLLAGHFAFSNLVQNVSSMIGLAVGIDYSLFLIHRFRENIARGEGDRDIALIAAMATAGKAIFFSGLTVMIGLGGLLLTPLLETRSIGWGGCLVVLAAMALSLTFLPALLATLGPRLDWPLALSRRLLRTGRSGHWQAWSQWVMSHAPLSAALALIVILAFSWPGLRARFGFPEGSFLPAELEFSRGHAMLLDMGLEGLVAPIHIVITRTDGDSVLNLGNIPALYVFSSLLRADTSVAHVFGPLDLADNWPLEKYLFLYADMESIRENAPFVSDHFLSRDGKSLLMQVALRPGTPLENAKALARRIPALAKLPGMKIAVGGQAAYYNDFDQAMRGAYPRTLGCVVAVTLLAMLLFFRSPLVSLKALIMNALSVAAGYGAVVWVFQLGHGHILFGLPGPTQVIPLTIPILLFCILFGLSMDYEVILLSRIREVFLDKGDSDLSVREGLASTGGMITSAALIMVAVFGAFAFARVVLVQMLGLGLAVAVLVDATLIRCLLLPALMKMAGRWNWWPGKV